MLFKTPKRKYKHSHFYLHEKGKKRMDIPKKQPIATIYSIQEKNIFLKPMHLEIIRRIVSKRLKQRRSNIRFRLHPTLLLSRKPRQVRMGKGKGKPYKWVQPLKCGTPIVDIFGRANFRYIKKILYPQVKYRMPGIIKITNPRTYIEKLRSIKIYEKRKRKKRRKHLMRIHELFNLFIVPSWFTTPWPKRRRALSIKFLTRR